MQKLFAWGAALVGIAVAAAAPAAAQVQTIRVGWCAKTISSAAAPFAIATKMGWFEKDGIKVELVPLPGSTDCVKLVATKELQASLPSVEPLAIIRQQGVKAKFFYTAYQGNIYGIAVPADSAINSITDLKGKKIGVQSIGGGVWMFSMLAFEHWGLDPERDNIQFRIIGDQSVLAQAITQNIIDGGYLGYAYGAQLERQGYRMLGDLMKMGIPYQGLGMIAKRSLIDRTPEIPERTLRAMVEAIAYINNPANKAAVVKTLTRELRLSKVEDAQAGYEMMRTLFDKRIYPNVDGLRNVVRLLGKSSEPIRKLKVEDIIDDRIVRKLEKEGLF